MITNLQPFVKRIRWSAASALTVAVRIALLTAVAAAQSVVSISPAAEVKAPRITPFGVQVPLDKAVPILRPAANAEPATDILQRTRLAHHTSQMAQMDMVGEGTVSVQTPTGPVTFAVTLIRNGEHGSQRILLQQPDGKLWDGKGEHLAQGGRQALEFLQTQHTRGVQQLQDSLKREATVLDNGIKDTARVVTVLEKSGDFTKYILDATTSRLARFEFVRGQSRDAAGNVSPIVQAYSFADVRTADGIATPFHVERSVNGVKQDELQLTKVQYSAATSSAAAPAVKR